MSVTDEMGGPVLSHEDFVRYFPPSRFDEGRLVAGALCLPPDHMNAMSIHRLGVYSSNDDDDLNEIRARSRIELKKNGGLVRWNTASFLGAAAQDPAFASLRAVRDPEPETEKYPADEAHALIVNMPSEDLMSDFLLDLVRNEIIERYPGKV
jgi:hypothetical protein